VPSAGPPAVVGGGGTGYPRARLSSLSPGDPGGHGVAPGQDGVEPRADRRVGGRLRFGAHLVEECRRQGLGFAEVPGGDRLAQGQVLPEEPPQAVPGLGCGELRPGEGDLAPELGRLRLRDEESLPLRPVAGRERSRNQEHRQDAERLPHRTLLLRRECR
jgi:hypothetical protein